MKFLNNIKGSAILALASLIWGLAFVAQAQAADLVPPFAFNSIRCFIGAIALFAVLGMKSAKTKKPIFPTEKAKIREMLIGGILCGIFLTVSVNFQQYGLSVYPDGSASEHLSSFITACPSRTRIASVGQRFMQLVHPLQRDISSVTECFLIDICFLFPRRVRYIWSYIP